MAAPNRPLPEGPVSDSRLATAAELEGLHEHLERLLTESEFLHPAHQKQVKLKLRRIFHKADARVQRAQHPARRVDVARPGEAPAAPPR